MLARHLVHRAQHPIDRLMPRWPQRQHGTHPLYVSVARHVPS